MAEINANVTKETMMLKLMSDVFKSDAKTVATVLKSIPDAESDALIEAVLESTSQEALDEAVTKFTQYVKDLNL